MSTVDGLLTGAFAIIRRIFQLFGLLPFGRVGSHVYIAWSLLQMTAILIFCGILFAFRQLLSVSFDRTDRVNVVLKVGTLIIGHISMLAETLHRRAAHRKLGATFRRFDRHCWSIEELRWRARETVQRSQCQSAAVFVLFATLVFCLHLVIVMSSKESIGWWWFWIVTWPAMMAGRLRHMQHAMYVHALRARVRIVADALRRMALARSDGADGAYRLRRFADVQMLADIVIELNVHVNRVFGVAQLLNVMQNFVQLSCDLFWLYTLLHSSKWDWVSGKEMHLMIVSAGKMIKTEFSRF